MNAPVVTTLTPEQSELVRQALKCKDTMKCPHMREAHSDMHGERYRCARCDASYYLDYEEMR